MSKQFLKEISNINETYFSEINTKEKAYILGYLLADGYINNSTLEFGCAIADKEILEFIAKELNANIRFDYTFDKKARRFPRARITIGNKHIIKDVLLTADLYGIESHGMQRMVRYDKGIEDEKQKVVEAGGLKIIGTERHESRRIDNQLRGRAGRQGDPGESRFYISLEDDLMRIFGSEKIQGVIDKLGLQEDEAIESKMVTKAIENAQKKVEGNNFDIRKNLLGYDDVMNLQREVIYKQRAEVLDGKNLRGSNNIFS